jgi:hypothetical protein
MTSWSLLVNKLPHAFLRHTQRIPDCLQRRASFFAPEWLPRSGQPREQDPVEISRALRPSFFDVLFVEPHSWHAPPFLVAGKREISGILPGAAVSAHSLNSGSFRVFLQFERRKAPWLQGAEAGRPSSESKNSLKSSAFLSCKCMNPSRISVNRLTLTQVLEVQARETVGCRESGESRCSG